MLSSYLPLLREFIPSAAEEIESDINANTLKQDCKFHLIQQSLEVFCLTTVVVNNATEVLGNSKQICVG